MKKAKKKENICRPHQKMSDIESRMRLNLFILQLLLEKKLNKNYKPPNQPKQIKPSEIKTKT